MNNVKRADEIYSYCKRIYGNSSDGSFEACLHFEGYYRVKNEESLLSKELKSFEEDNHAIKRIGYIQEVGNI